MQNSTEPIPTFDIKDTYNLVEKGKTNFSEDEKNEFLFIRSRCGVAVEQPHKSNFYSLSIALSGRCTQMINDHQSILSPGSLLYTTPKDVTASIECGPQLEIRQLLFTKPFLLSSNLPPEALDELLWVEPGQPPLFELDKRAFAQTTQLFEKIAEEASLSKAYHKHILRNGIIELLYRMNRLEKPCLKKEKNSGSRSNRLFNEFKDMVEEQYQEKKKVKEYAEMLHVTPKHLSEIVKKESGQTALEHIHRFILREAKNQLTHTNKSAKKIAYNLGYNTPSQFGRFFKRKTGRSPIQFRKNRKTAH